MNKSRRKRIIALAYFHRYGWIALMFLCFTIHPLLYIPGLFLIAFSIWTLLGYLLKWKHIYCSYQSAYRKPMTPYHINWNIVRKSDAYGTPIIFFILGVGLIVVPYF